ncbi:MAG: radical SAM protein [Deltaproteobacteria bacterium]|nr:radical SAM protein [Deltaproteobacteria bacterium]
MNCRHCWQHKRIDEDSMVPDGNNAEIPPADLFRVIKEAKELGLYSIKFTGGEPFMNPLFIDYLNIAKNEGLRVVIETNGTLLEESHIPRLKALNLREIAISLDGANQETHDNFRQKKGAYLQTLAALKLLAKYKLPVQLIMCIHRKNKDELGDLLLLAEQYKVNSVKINPIQPMGRGQELAEKGECLPLSELLELSKYCRENLSKSFSGNLFFGLPISFRPFEEIRDRTFSVCQIFSILGLLSGGELSFCGIGHNNRELIFGNIYEDSLPDVWKGAPLLNELRQCLPKGLKGVCGRCLLKSTCLGECRAEAYERTGDLLAPHWICQEALDSNLFPTTRLLPAADKLKE